MPDADDPYKITSRMMEALPSGSFLAVSHASSDIETGLAAAGAERYNQRSAVPVILRSRAQVTRFFDGLDVVDPGVVPLGHWHPGPLQEFDSPGLPTYCAVGRRPSGAAAPRPRPTGRYSVADDPGTPIDTGVAHIARVYDFWLGGTSNFPADREAAGRVIEAYPDIRVSVRAQRAFLGRAVHFLAAETGIRQFLDIGTGLPSAGDTHEVARRASQQARIVYVDNDPIVLAHARALLTSTPEGACARISARICGTPRGSCGRPQPPSTSPLPSRCC